MRHFTTTQYLGVLFLFCTVGCDKEQEPVSLPDPEVTVATPIELSITDYDRYQGRVEAVKEIELRARVSGYLQKIGFKDGDRVEKDQLLFQIDLRPFQASVNQAEADLKTVQARVTRLDAEYRRGSNLLAKRAISQEEFDKIAGDLAEAKAQIISHQQQIERAKLDLEYATITAPWKGRISAALVKEGNLVTKDNTLLAHLVQNDNMEVIFDVDERSLLQYKRAFRKGEAAANKTVRDLEIPVFVGLEGEDGYPHEGMLVYASPVLDTGTGTIEIRGKLDNKDNLLAHGNRARVRIPVSDPYKALLITERAIGTDQSKRFVYVVNKENRVDRRDVKLGRTKEDLVVIKEGVQADDQVIVNGIQRVRPGITVIPIQVEMPGTPPKVEN